MTTPQDKLSHAALVLQTCASTFRKYENIHMEKIPPEFDKAKHNAYMAGLCETAIQFLDVETTSTDVEHAVLVEREACAKVCESLFDADDDSCNEAELCAAAIRARGESENTKIDIERDAARYGFLRSEASAGVNLGSYDDELDATIDAAMKKGS
jgi:hypothetical protein